MHGGLLIDGFLDQQTLMQILAREARKTGRIYQDTGFGRPVVRAG